MPETQIQVKLNPDVNPSGSDLAVVNAARRSFNTRSDWEYEKKQFKAYDGEWLDHTVKVGLKEKDKRLIQFLARGMTADDFKEFIQSIHKDAIWADVYDAEHMYDEDYDGIDFTNLTEKLWQWRNTPTHDTPFNHCFISFEVKAPIFVSRQLVKHEYLIMSEFSRRYITDDIEFYIPDTWRKASENKKQGSSDEAVNLYDHVMFENHGIIGPWMLGEEMDGTYAERSVDLFNKLLKAGVAPEQARMVLPQSTMTEWTWSGTLGAFAKMCQLRLHPEAQYESRLVARQVYDYLLQFYPVSAKALVEGADV